MKNLLRHCLVAAAVAVASHAAIAANTFDDLVYVPGDRALATAGTTRAEYNKKNPAAEKAWRKAWAAEGQKWDSRELAGIRQTTSKPSDVKAESAAPAPSAPAKKKGA